MLYFVPRETTGGNEMPPSNTASIARRYGDAWNAHDLDEIVAMQIPEMEFELKLTGYPPARGVAEVAQQFRFLFVSWPDVHFTTQSLLVAEAFFVHQFRFTATLAGAFPIAGQVIEATGQGVDLDGVDVITTSGGLVASKHTYMDAFALRAQLGLGEPEASGP
jgi:ketosteroid isomerase-like protein